MTSNHKKSLVLVIGAGGSNEVGLPVGGELKEKIAKHLDIRFDDFGSRTISGNTLIFNALNNYARKHGENVNDYLHACWLIRDAMPQASSIDNFINDHRDNKRIELCGKFAIAFCILEAEEKSKIRVDTSNVYNKIDISRVEHTWFNLFFKLLATGYQKADLRDRLSQVAIITFNYDRCIEHFFHQSLMNYYGINSAEAKEIISELKIYHPYGCLGPLPWQLHGGIEYGTKPHANTLMEVSARIKTFTEGTDESHSDIIAIRGILRESAQVAYLGFSFNLQNLELLHNAAAYVRNDVNCDVYGTAQGLSGSDCHVITAELSKLGKYSSSRIQLRQELSCAGLINEYGRRLTKR